MIRPRAAFAALALLALASCSATQMGQGEVGYLIPQLLGIAILAWIVILLI